MAVPFDQDKLTLTGDPVAIAEGLDLRVGDAADVAISHTGTLMYTTRPQPREITELVWVERSGSLTLIERSQRWASTASKTIATNPESVLRGSRG